MRISENMPLCPSGSIMFKIHNKDKELVTVRRSNVITYTGADIMARLLGGDTRYIPSHIGFMYGDDPTAASLTDPDNLPATTKRAHPWSAVAADTAGATANVIVAPLVLKPQWESSSAGTYSGNIVTIAAFTGSYLEYAFPTTGATYAGEMGSLANIYFYQALLLNRQENGSEIVYRPFARVTLRDPISGNYHEKPAGFDLSLFWGVTFS